MDLSDDDLHLRAEGDRQEIDPPIQVETAAWSKAGQLDWWVRERQEWWGRVRGADSRQQWIRAVDLRPVNGSQPMTPTTTLSNCEACADDPHEAVRMSSLRQPRRLWPTAKHTKEIAVSN
jgi:hypothetical protein